MQPAIIRFAIAGAALGLLTLTKPSFAALLPAALGIVFAFGAWATKLSRNLIGLQVLVLAVVFACIVAPWMVRNYVSVGKFGLTKEYASATLVERLAYDDMTAQEFVLAFPYCMPGVGDALFDKIYGSDVMHRFMYHTPGSFFHSGRERRDALIEQNGGIDPLIGQLVLDEMSTNWWRYLLVTVPLAWCGMWPGGIVTLLLVPLFALSLLHATRAREPGLILYSAPAVLLLTLHAAVANHYTRYNLILTGPYCVGAAWIICSALPYVRWRARSLASGP
jgi:4-amino-4-deoxy-L-arabinose transferase-like glycosyltransferase